MMIDFTQKYQQAQKLAIISHKNQKYGNNPYEYHLQKVVDVLLQYGCSLEDEITAPILIAAWLHDSLEDTSLTYEEIKTDFGANIAELVWRVTDEPGTTRKERKLATYCKTKENEAAIILKLADRIANVEASLENSNKLNMYKNEYSDFKKALQPFSESILARKMWHHLDQLLTEK